MKLQYTSILHASFLIQELNNSIHFYCDVLGFEIDPDRPDLGYPGAWLKIGSQQQIHLIQLPNPDSKHRPEHGGHDRHIAIQVNSSTALRKLLEQHNISYTQSRSRKNVIFVRDPDMNTLELIGVQD